MNDEELLQMHLAEQEQAAREEFRTGIGRHWLETYIAKLGNEGMPTDVTLTPLGHELFVEVYSNVYPLLLLGAVDSVVVNLLALGITTGRAGYAIEDIFLVERRTD